MPFVILFPHFRVKLQSELHGLVYLTEVLGLITNGDATAAAAAAVDSNETGTTLDKDQVNLTNELLKVLFNLTLNTNDRELDEVFICIVFALMRTTLFNPLDYLMNQLAFYLRMSQGSIVRILTGCP